MFSLRINQLTPGDEFAPDSPHRQLSVSVQKGLREAKPQRHPFSSFSLRLRGSDSRGAVLPSKTPRCHRVLGERLGEPEPEIEDSGRAGAAFGVRLCC